MHGAFSIEQATPHDFAELVALRHREDWAPNAWLFDALASSGLGRIVIARSAPGTPGRYDQGESILAAAVGTAYGDLGVIGNVIVQASHRARGLGRAVMETELAWLRQRSVRYVELDATEHGRPLYEKLGFVQRAPSWMLRETVGRFRAHHGVAMTAGATIGDLSPMTLQDVVGLDQQAFGGDRMPLLAAVLALPETRGWAARDERDRAVGYVFARPTESRPRGVRIGPWVAQNPHLALDLIRHAVSMEADVAMDEAPLIASVPGVSAVVTGCFAETGLPVVPDDVRMRLTFPVGEAGTDHTAEVARADWVYGMLAPMVG